MRNKGNGVGIMTLLASAAAAGLLFVLATVGLVLAAVFVLVFLGASLFMTRRGASGRFAKTWVFRNLGNPGNSGNPACGPNRGRHRENMFPGTCYDLDPEDYSSRPAPRKLRSGGTKEKL